MRGRTNTTGMRKNTVTLGEKHVHVKRAAKQKYKCN